MKDIFLLFYIENFSFKLDKIAYEIIVSNSIIFTYEIFICDLFYVIHERNVIYKLFFK